MLTKFYTYLLRLLGVVVVVACTTVFAVVQAEPAKAIVSPAQSGNLSVHNLVGGWVGTATNTTSNVSGKVAIVVVRSDSQKVRAFGGFDNKTLFGSIDANGYQVPCSKVTSKDTNRCFDLTGIVRFGDDGSGFPSGTQAGMHLSLQVKSGTNKGVGGDYRIEPIANFVPTPQLGTLNLPQILSEPDVSLKLAQGLHLNAEHDAAFPIYARLLSKYPNNADIYWQSGQWLGNLKRYDAAIRDLRRVTELKPDFADAWGSLGWYLMLQGDFPAAQMASAKAQTLAPDSFLWTINLGHTYFLQGDEETARIWYKKSMPLLPDEASLKSGPLADFDLFIERGWQVAESHQERAWYEQEAKRVISINNKKSELLAESRALAQRAFELYQQKKFQEGDRLATQALSIQEQIFGPDHPNIAASLNGLAGLYASQGRHDYAEKNYKRALAIREQALGAQHPDVATSLNDLAQLYLAKGQYAQAEPLYQRALAIREKVLGAQHLDVATSLNNLAWLYQVQAKYAQAEPLHQRALAIKEQALGAKHQGVAISLNNLAALYYAQGKYAEAEPLYQRAMAINEQALGAQHPLVATNLNNLATLYKAQGKYTRAEPLYQRAMAIREQALGAQHPDVALSLNNLAGLYRDQGKYDQAEPLYKSALAIREQVLGAQHPDVAASLDDLAMLYLAKDQYAQAEPLYQRAMAIKEQALDAQHPLVATGIGSLAYIYYKQRNYTQALEYIRRASGIYHDRILANSRIASTGGDSERNRFKNTFAWHLKIAAARMAEATALRAELTAETFAIGQLFHDGPVGDAIARMAARFAGGSDTLATLARDKEDTQTAWQKAEADVITAVGKPTAEQDTTLIKTLRDRSQALHTQLTALNERLAKEFPDYAELTIPRPVILDQAQRLLKRGEALVAYSLGATKSWVWLITPESASFRQIDRTAEDIDKQVKTLRVTLSPDPDDNVGLQQPFPVATAHALYQDILGPEAAHLTGVKTLFVVADGALESLPFAVLVTEAPTGDPMDYKHISWLSRTIATATLPTVSSLRALRTLNTTGTAAAKPFIGFGNPDFGTGDDGTTTRSGKKRRGKTGTTKNRTAVTMAITRGTMADPTELRKLQPLPETADELRAIAKTLGAGPKSVILGKKATVPAVTTSPLAQYRVVDFATHALVAGDIEKLQLGGQVEPAIVLTPPKVATTDNDGLLRASQVAQLKLNADWVILSACNTAAPDGTPGAVGLSGLAKAFFYAGAKAMLVSHWSVASKPAVALTTNMFKIWQDQPELGRAEALRQAEMAVLDNPDEEYFAHPGAWAPFIVAGEGGGDATTLALLDSNTTAAPTTPTIAVDFAMLQQRTVFSKPTPIQEGDTLSSGDGYFFHLQTGDGPQNYLYVYQIDSAGKVFRLFPNKKYRTATNPIPAHKRITLPNEGEEFFLDSTTGKEDFYFIASTTSLPALEKLERGTVADITNQGLKSRGTAGIRTKTATVAAPTGETKSTVQEFIFADNLVHSFSIKHK